MDNRLPMILKISGCESKVGWGISVEGYVYLQKKCEGVNKG